MTREKQPKTVVAQLSKAPILGRVKTRMQPKLRLEESTRLHRLLTEHTVKALADSGLFFLHLWIDEDHAFFSELETNYAIALKTQSKGDLGERLSAISASYIDQPHILIGSDCPYITQSLIERILAHLTDEHVDLVMVPASDGGYVALALKNAYPALFRDIDWGSENVAKQTLARARDLGLRVVQLPALHDIDRPEDLHLLEAFDIQM